MIKHWHWPHECVRGLQRERYILSPRGLVDAHDRRKLLEASVTEQECEGNNTVQPIRSALVQATVAGATNPDGVHHVIPELCQVAAEALSLDGELLEEPSCRCARYVWEHGRWQELDSVKGCDVHGMWS